jgi:deoxyhypusine synthase
VTWGKVDPEQLPDSVVAYVDSTVAFPILAAYALAKREPRPLKRLYDRRDDMLAALKESYDQYRPDDWTDTPEHAGDTAAGHAVGRSTLDVEETES